MIIGPVKMQPFKQCVSTILRPWAVETQMTPPDLVPRLWFTNPFIKASVSAVRCVGFQSLLLVQKIGKCLLYKNGVILYLLLSVLCVSGASFLQVAALKFVNLHTPPGSCGACLPAAHQQWEESIFKNLLIQR